MPFSKTSSRKDGEIHQLPENVKYDVARQEDIEFCNLKVIRFSNNQVLENIELVVKEIKKHLSDQ
ncbi:endonuclease domain-containing protein [Solitalea canadensis]|uniref:endonuclease domain-containing protein n=1 Tax=Solitalea canadensis TaxID=995 RepID=UPI001C2616EB